jgi:DNA-directed RNA polymerase specialized sigma24 family protein
MHAKPDTAMSKDNKSPFAGKGPERVRRGTDMKKDGQVERNGFSGQSDLAGPCVCQQSKSGANLNTGPCHEMVGLCEAYRLNPENADICEKFVKRCIILLKKKINYYVLYQHKCPRFLAPGTFADDVLNLALVKFWAGIRSLRNPAELNAWLSRVASSAVFDELRGFTRRKKNGPVEWETIHTMHFGEEANIVDEEMTCQSAEHGHTLSYVADLKQLIHRDILDKVFNSKGNGSKDEEQDWLALKLNMEFTIDEIAEQIGTAKPKLQYMLKKSKRKFRIIAKHHHKFTGSDL